MWTFPPERAAMANAYDFSGIFPPIPTVFENDRLAVDQMAANVTKWCTTGIAGVLVLGSNGEYVYLSEDEKRRAVQTVVQAAPQNRLVLAGTGCESTAATIRLTRDCAALGVHAALVVTPCYYGSQMTPRALIHHYETLADASPIPILLYNVPKFTGINLDVATVAHLAQHPRIVGIKDSTGNVAQLGALLNAVPRDFYVLVGTAGALLGALSLGCVGGILALANVAPEACVAIWQAAKNRQWEAARRLQLKMLPVNAAVTATYGIAGLKYALDLCGYFGGLPRPPLLPLSEDQKREVRRILAGAELPAA